MEATGIVAAVTAIPAVGLATTLRVHPGDDKLLTAIRRYKSEVAAINASHGLTDEDLPPMSQKRRMGSDDG
jgi:hypothetical protein